MSCVSCTQLAPIVKDTSACNSSKQKLDNFRIACCDQIIETQTATTTPDCTYGYIDEIVYENILFPTPFVSIDITNSEEIDELDDFSYDRTTDVGTDTYSITLNIKIYNPEHECTLNSFKGQDVCIAYKITGKDGDWVWRRFKGKLTALTGGLIAGYAATFDILNPSSADKPKFINFGTAAATQVGMDTLTVF